MHKITTLAVAILILGAAVPAPCATSPFAGNEVGAASVKDRLRSIRTTLKDGSEGARRLSTAIADAFKDTGDWAPATEAYYARKNELATRATALEEELDAVIAGNSPERSEAVNKSLDKVAKKDAVLRSDYEFYMKLPKLAAGPHRRAAQAAMRLLAQTNDYPVSLAFFLDKTPNRAPFAPLPPGVMSIRHR